MDEGILLSAKLAAKLATKFSLPVLNLIRIIWHVRNKKNIERVRKDEEQAANEEKERERRKAVAESEARSEALRIAARKRRHDDDDTDVVQTTQKHLNFFEDLEAGKKTNRKNADHEEEKRQEKEKQEKAIGLLTYLGQGSVELQDTKPWYFEPPKKKECSFTSDQRTKDEFDSKRKRSIDPMSSMTKYIDQTQKYHNAKEGKPLSSKHERRPKHKSSSSKTNETPASKTIDQLRAERLKREQQERFRQQQLLAKLQGTSNVEETVVDERKCRYNSQFNPDLARR